MRASSRLVALFVIAAAAVAAAPPPKLMIVVCSPGSPGSTEEARARMDAFAASASAKAGVPLAATYEPTEEGGVARLKESGIGLVSLPFFLKHEIDLALRARLGAVQKGRPALERWVLVAQAGRVKNAAALSGLKLMSSVAFAPAFVRGAVASELGQLPRDVEVVQSTAVLSTLRRIAEGAPMAVLLDGPQAAALDQLAFAAQLEVVARSPAMPAGLFVTADKRVSDKTWDAIGGALLGLASDRAGAEALEGIQTARFVPVDDKALIAARAAYGSGAK